MGHKIRWIIIALSSVLFLSGAIKHIKKAENHKKNDFLVYYKTSERVLVNNWDDIFTRKDGAFPYRYVPYSLMTVSWMNQFSEANARKIWVIIQVTSFAAAFYFLRRCLIMLDTDDPSLKLALTFFLMFRYYLDSLCSGQVAGIIFLAFSLGLYFTLQRKFITAAAVNFFSASLKVIPGILLIHPLVKIEGMSKKIKLFVSIVLLFLLLNLCLMLWLYAHNPESNTFQVFGLLWKNWLDIVLADGEYFDGSTPKSQALRGFILRTFGKVESSEIAWKISVLLSIAAIVFHWIVNKSQTLMQEAYSYSLGIMFFILLMPESLPYQIMNIGIPLMLLISHPKMKTSKLYKGVIAAFIIFMTMPSSDFIGRRNSDILQSYSLSFFVMCALTIVIYKDSWVKKSTANIA